MFPISDTMPRGENGLIVCQDTSVTLRTLPIFQFDPTRPDERVRGLGTCFRVDPWTTCMSAFHVFEDLFDPAHPPIDGQGSTLREDVRMAALEIVQRGYGTLPLPDNCWRPLQGLYSPTGLHNPPMQMPRIINLTELVTVQISSQLQGHNNYWPVKMSGWQPTKGETVCALGYADIDRSTSQDDDRPISQTLYGSFAQIEEIIPAHSVASRPWPSFRVSAEWPGGMSGGPVFNSDGVVIGFVSSGMSSSVFSEPSSAAVYFSGWTIDPHFAPQIDRLNPNRFNGHVTLDNFGNPTEFVPIGMSFDCSGKTAVSMDITTGEFIRI